MSCIVDEVTIGDCRLILGDCRDVLPLLPKVDAIVSDPPYGIAYAHSGGGKGIGGGKYATKFGGEFIHGDDKPFDPQLLLGIDANMILWGANHYADKLPSSPNWLIWDKHLQDKNLSFAEAELAWCNFKGNAKVFRHLWDGMMKASERGVERVHPTQKCIALMAWCIDITKTPIGGTILDPYMGSATTGIACIQTGHKFIGIEYERKYFDIAVERIKQAYAQPRLFEDAKPAPQQQTML